MKIAIVGLNFFTIQCAYKLFKIGAGVSLFTNESFLDSLSELKLDYEFKLTLGDIVCADSFKELKGCDLSDLCDPSLKLNFGDTKIKNAVSEYFKSLYLLLEKQRVIKINKVLSIQKTLLNPEENPINSTRLKDLFRVVFEVNHEEFIERDSKETESLYSKLDDKTIKSLSRPTQNYDDFDLIIYGHDLFKENRYLGVYGGSVIGDNNEHKEQYINYGYSFLKLSIDSMLASKNTMITIDDSTNLDSLLKVFKESILKEKFESVTFVSRDSFLSKLNQSLISEFNESIKVSNDKLNIELEKWKALEDWEKVKVKKPALKGPVFKIKEGFVVSSFDILNDQDKIFVNLDKNSFSESVKDEMLDSFYCFRQGVIAVDKLICATSPALDLHKIYNLNIDVNSFKSNDFINHYHHIHDEPGFYSLVDFTFSEKPSLIDQKRNFDSSFECIHKNILNFFSKTAIVLLILNLFYSCSHFTYDVSEQNTNTKLDRREIEQFRDNSILMKYFLPDIPSWANFSEIGKCSSSNNIKYLDYDRLNKSYQFSYKEAIHFQFLYNKIYQNKVLKRDIKSLSMDQEQMLFYEVTDRIQNKLYGINLPSYKLIGLWWIDPFVNKTFKINKIKKQLHSRKYSKFYPVFISHCLSHSEVENFIKRFSLTDGRYTVLSKESFSVYDVNFRAKPYFSLNLGELFSKKQKLFFISPRAQTFSGELRGRFKKIKY